MEVLRNKGKNYFKCNNKITLGPSSLKPLIMILTLLILIPSFLFTYYELPYYRTS